MWLTENIYHDQHIVSDVYDLCFDFGACDGKKPVHSPNTNGTWTSKKGGDIRFALAMQKNGGNGIYG